MNENLSHKENLMIKINKYCLYQILQKLTIIHILPATLIKHKAVRMHCNRDYHDTAQLCKENLSNKNINGSSVTYFNNRFRILYNKAHDK